MGARGPRRLLCLGALIVGALTATSGAAGAASPTPQEAQALGKQAYDYGFPLLEFTRVRREQTSVRCPDRIGNAPVNSFSNAKGFANPLVRTVVAPNTDTLYSVAHLNLERGPITLSWPRMGKRYYSFEMLDPYTNVIDIPGLREDGGSAGKVEVRWDKAIGKPKPPNGARLIRSRYKRVWVIGRTLATNTPDQRKAKRLMAQYKLRQPNGKQRSFPANCKPGDPAKYPTPTSGPRFVGLLNKQLAKSPPPQRDKPLLKQLKTVGVGAGLSPESADLTPEARAALYQGVADEAASLPGSSRIKAYAGALQTEGWFLPDPKVGDYGTDYDLRAFFATVGLGANTPEEAIYPAGIADGAGVLYNGANDYRLTFPPGDTPPAKYFWSLTMYDSDGYLVPNSAHRYSVGPSHPPLMRKPDGSVVIAIQQAQPSESGVNWLPSPSGGFRLNLRLYGPSKAAQNGTWRPPGVVEVGP